jgi:hypothetical protein
MDFMKTLTKLVLGMSRLGEHMLRQKVGGIIVAALAFACGAGLAHALGGEPLKPPAAAAAQTADPARAEVVMRNTAAAEDEEKSAVFDKGEYENYAYGYSVRIPAGMVGLGPPPPAPQHGFGIDLDHPRSTGWVRGSEFPESYVYVDGSYNSMEYGGLDAAVNSHLSFLREKGRDGRVQSREKTRLGGLPAARVVARYVEGGVEMVSDEVVAFRVEDDGELSVFYTLGLSTPGSKYERDRPVLEELMRGWRLQPVE